MASAETWVDSGDLSWPIHLLEAGYDVWLGNNRGNLYSRGHTTMTAEMDAYFNFSFYEMGRCDLPAMIDRIKSHTGQKQVAVIGHSQGTT
jgi:lysosomal acid lipase/cholesteryl ester hydrolase